MKENKPKRNYKYCIVPKCKSTTVTTPNKIFFSVPKQGKVRRQWCKVMKRCPKKNKVLSNSTALFCCEDHFNLQEDMENFWQHKLLQNVERYKLKKGVLPHIFTCQGESPIQSQNGLAKYSNLMDLENVGEIKPADGLPASSKDSETSEDFLHITPLIKIEIEIETEEEGENVTMNKSQLN